MTLQLTQDRENTVESEDYKQFIVTGLLYNSKTRFRRAFNINQVRYAFGINLWRGSVWGVRKDNDKRQRLKYVFN